MSRRQLSGHGQPLTDVSESIKAPGGSRGTPGMSTIPRGMHSREEPNDPVSPDFRPGLLVNNRLIQGGDGTAAPADRLAQPGSADARRALELSPNGHRTAERG